MFRYAGTVMDVCKVNQELNRHLEDVAAFTAQVRGARRRLESHQDIVLAGWFAGRLFLSVVNWFSISFNKLELN